MMYSFFIIFSIQSVGFLSQKDPWVDIKPVHITETMDSENRILHIDLKIYNKLPVNINRIYIGLILADDANKIKEIDANDYYKKSTGFYNNVGVILIEKKTNIPLKNQKNIHIEYIIPHNFSFLEGYMIHLLGYETQDIPTEIILEWITTSSSADQWAAVTSMNLFRIFKKNNVSSEIKNRLIHTFNHELSKPIPEIPSHQETQKRIFSLLCLDILGKGKNKHVYQFSNNPKSAFFDEPLQVFRIAKLQGSIWSAPLAYAINDDVEIMKDITTEIIKR